MNIGCLGWGSLVWNPNTLQVRSEWFRDGPLLPVEFARASGGNRVTLVLLPPSPLVRVLWCLLATPDLRTAVDMLAAREGVPKSKERNIGFWSHTAGARGTCADLIGPWADGHQLDAVVWTNLGPKWEGEEGRIPSPTEVVEYVRQQGPDSEAANYVLRAPTQVVTDLRRRMSAEIDWLKHQAG